MGVTESRGQKNDTRDAYGLAEKLRTGALDKRIFKAPREFSVLRELARMHLTVVRDVVRVQSRLKSLYRSRGIAVPGASVYGARDREDWEKRLPPSARRRAARLYAQLDFLIAQRDEAERDLLHSRSPSPCGGRRPDRRIRSGWGNASCNPPLWKSAEAGFLGPVVR